MHPDWKRICNDYMKATSYSPEEMDSELWKDRHYDPKNRPETYLTYPEAKIHIPLEQPKFPASSNIWSVLQDRRSKRNFISEPITLNELNLLLWGTQGITADLGDYQLRTVPSAGALFPIETYLLVNNVEGLEKGLYHFDVKNRVLEGLKLEDVSDFSFRASLNQEMAKISGVNFVWTAMIERCRAKYYERAYRYVWWDTGHISQNLYLTGTALGLGVCCAGAWHDNLLSDYLEIDGKDHFPTLFASVGKIEGIDWQYDRRITPKT